MDCMVQSEEILREQKRCGKCHETFDKPKLVKYFACPHCLTKIEEKNEEKGCQYWFGYLNQKDKNESIPKDCIECERVVGCMLNKDNSAAAVVEIKKWY